jgi:hypothetical protein
MHFLTLFARMAVLAVLALTLVPPVTGATIPLPDQIFSFQGVCSDCEGTVTAELRLTGNYVLGNQILPEHFVSFYYGGSNLLAPYMIDNSEEFHIDGYMTGVPGTADVRIGVRYRIGPSDLSPLSEVLPVNLGYFFATCSNSDFCKDSSDGYWTTGDILRELEPADFGYAHSWGPSDAPGGEIPEPATFTLLGAGLAAFALVRRRART